MYNDKELERDYIPILGNIVKYGNPVIEWYI